MTHGIVAPRDLHAPPRRAVWGPPPRRAPAPTRLGWALGLVILILATGIGVAVARAEEVDPPRAQPAARGDRPAVEERTGALRATGAHLERAEVLDLLAAHFPPEEVEAALAVLSCESRFDAAATGRAGERGYFQIHPLWQPLADALFWPGASLYDPEVNVATAAAIWRSSGWAPWSCRPW